MDGKARRPERVREQAARFVIVEDSSFKDRFAQKQKRFGYFRAAQQTGVHEKVRRQKHLQVKEKGQAQALWEINCALSTDARKSIDGGLGGKVKWHCV